MWSRARRKCRKRSTGAARVAIPVIPLRVAVCYTLEEPMSQSSSRLVLYVWSALLAATLLLSGCATPTSNLTAQEIVPAVPAPALDEAPGQAQTEVAVLAGGCFWGVQGVFQHVTGVTQAVSEYAGGSQATAEYEV